MTEHKTIEEGRVLLVSRGAGEGYEVDGLWRALCDLDLRELEGEYQAALTNSHFMEGLARRGCVEALEHTELHLGSTLTAE